MVDQQAVVRDGVVAILLHAIDRGIRGLEGLFQAVDLITQSIGLFDVLWLIRGEVLEHCVEMTKHLNPGAGRGGACCGVLGIVLGERRGGKGRVKVF